MTRENNAYLNQTITYEYDKGGNLTKKTVYPYTTGSLSGVTATSTKMYSYGNSSWTDLLTSYDGQAITYDGIGNPLSYLGYTITWNGRQLSTLKGNGVTASYKYDADGLRSYKKVGNVESTYQYLGGKLVYEKRGDIELQYGYNSYGDLTLLRYTEADGTVNYYYAVCNSRGDVEGIYNGAGELRAHYTYDSWGNVISITDQNGKEITSSTHIGILNPIRYRGYYYDAETGMYYVGSRYYNPEVGRWLNTDNQLSTGDMTGMNLFAYCGNNPVNRIDPTGEAWYHWAIGVGIVAGLAVATVISAGSFAFAMTAVGFAAGGISVGGVTGGLAMATIGSSYALGAMGFVAAFNSNSVSDFNAQGNW